MGIIILYLISLGLFWVATMVVPLLFVPVIWLFKAVLKDLIPTPVYLFFANLIATILLLYLTQYIWFLLGYKIGWFPILVLIQNFIAYISKQTNANAKNQALAIVIGSILFLIINMM